MIGEPGALSFCTVLPATHRDPLCEKERGAAEWQRGPRRVRPAAHALRPQAIRLAGDNTECRHLGTGMKVIIAPPCIFHQ